MGVSILKTKDCSSALLYVQAQDQYNNPIILFSYLNEDILYMLSTSTVNIQNAHRYIRK